MAGPASEYHHGDQDIREQRSTYHLVMNITKWGALITASVILLLVLWFAVPGAGFLSGVVAAAVLLAIGIAVLRERAPAH